MKRRRKSRENILWLVVLCALLLMGWGCGKKGDPIPPEKPASQSIAKVQALAGL